MIDAKQRSVAVTFNVVALVLTILVIIPLFIVKKDVVLALFDRAEGEELSTFLLREFLFLFSLFAGVLVYMVLHELTHGAAYKLLTHQKLTFGFTPAVAFCGVPQVYVSKKTALIALLSPFVLFTAILLPLALVFGNSFVTVLFGLLFAIHFGGCVGDLYYTFLILTKYDKTALFNDTGPKQSFYVKE